MGLAVKLLTLSQYVRCRLTVSPCFLSVSPSPPDRSGAEVALKCSLLGRTGHRGCGDKRLLWVDEAGTVLSGDGVRSEDTVGGCVSILTVNSGHGRRYTCRLVDESNGNNVQIQADHTLVVTGRKAPNEEREVR